MEVCQLKNHIHAYAKFSFEGNFICKFSALDFAIIAFLNFFFIKCAWFPLIVFCVEGTWYSKISLKIWVGLL